MRRCFRCLHLRLCAALTERILCFIYKEIKLVFSVHIATSFRFIAFSLSQTYVKSMTCLLSFFAFLVFPFSYSFHAVITKEIYHILWYNIKKNFAMAAGPRSAGGSRKGGSVG